jgi:hypothetical protein
VVIPAIQQVEETITIQVEAVELVLEVLAGQTMLRQAELLLMEETV